MKINYSREIPTITRSVLHASPQASKPRKPSQPTILKNQEDIRDMRNLKEFFDSNEDEFLKFDRVENPLSNRLDMHAFMLLDKLAPGTREMVSGAEHDEIYLSIELERLNGVATDSQLIDLIRCGVRYDHSYDCLVMFT